MTKVKCLLTLGLGLVLASWLFPGVSIRPARANATEDCKATGAIGAAKLICLSANAEDLVALPNSDWVIANGILRAINIRDHSEVVLFSDAAKFDKTLYGACPGPLDGKEIENKKFIAHGINIRPGPNGVHTLYAIHHGRSSVEVFEIDARPKTPTITWVGCVPSPPDFLGADITVLPDNGFAITNFLRPSLSMAPSQAGGGWQAKFANGEVTGEVWEWAPGTGWKIVPDSEGSGPNGIEASKDGKWLYVNYWGAQKVARISRGRTPVTKEFIALDFHPDNVHWQSDGSLLVAGQHGSSDDFFSSCSGKGECSKISTSIARLNPDTLKLDELVHQYPANDHFKAGTTALIVGKEIWAGSVLRGDSLVSFPLP